LSTEQAEFSCLFESDARDARIRVALVGRKDLNRWLNGRDHDEMSSTPTGATGRLQVAAYDPETYVIIENRGLRPANVHLRVYLDEPPVQYLSRARRLAVVAISFGVFCAIVSFSARKLLKAVRNT
jgi:hypothetical protein